MKSISLTAAVKFLGCILVAVYASQANAECFVSPTWKNVFARMNGGVITVKPTDPVGTVLKEFITDVPLIESGSRPEEIKNGVYFRVGQCIGGGSFHYAALKGSPVAGLDNVFDTNIPGIGIRFSMHWNLFDGSPQKIIYTKMGTATTFNRSPGTDNIYWPYGMFFHTEIIKTAMATGSGSVDPGTYSTVYFGGSGPGMRSITSTLGARVITIISPTCSVDSGSTYQRVTLKTVPAGSFKGARSTAGDTPFNIRINCNAGTGSVAPLTVSLAFQGTMGQGTSLKDGVLAQTLTTADAAKNIGIQMVRSDLNNLPVTIGGENTIGTTKDGQYVVPFIARYFQLASEPVTPGKVAASTTFLLQYK